MTTSDLPPPDAAPAGWYPDPYTGGQRYFDGRAWVGPPVVPVVVPPLAAKTEHPTLPFRAAWGALVVLTLSLVVAKLVLDVLVDRDWPLVVYIALAAVMSYGPSIAWVLYVRKRWGAGRFTDLGWRFRWSDLGWGPLTWLVAIVTQATLAVIIIATDIPFTSNLETGEPGSSDRTYIVALLVAAVIAAPLVEEVVFRGLVMRGFLSASHPAIAIGAQAILFGAAHVDPARGAGNIGLVFVLSGVGVVLGCSAYLFRRLGPVVLAHAILNGVALTLALSGVLDDVDSPFEMLALIS
jgi:membrane protease YdiL (CAAX protease family)